MHMSIQEGTLHELPTPQSGGSGRGQQSPLEPRMGKSPKPFESPLAPTLAADILNIPVESEGDLPPPRTVGEVVRRSVEMVNRANAHLQGSQVARIVAKSLMQDLKKRGDATIFVRHDGTVVLRVTYGDEEEPQAGPRTRRDAPVVVTQHKSDLPYLDDLRRHAAELGVDISHLGRQRRAIHEYLEAHARAIKPGVDEVRVLAPPKALPPRRP